MHQMLWGTSPHVILRSILGPGHIITILTLQTRKLRPREAKPLAQAHTATKGQDWDSNPGPLTSEGTFPSTLPPTKRGDQEESFYVLETKRPRRPGVETMNSYFNIQQLLSTYCMPAPQGSHGDSPKKGHPDQESPLGPPPPHRRVT